jgi:hypothetical protein
MAWGANCRPYNVLVTEALRFKPLMRRMALEPYVTVWPCAPDVEYLRGLARAPEYNLDRRTCLPLPLDKALEILDNAGLTFAVSYVVAEESEVDVYAQWAYSLTNHGGLVVAIAPAKAIKGDLRRWAEATWADVIPLDITDMGAQSRDRKWVAIRATKLGDE